MSTYSEIENPSEVAQEDQDTTELFGKRGLLPTKTTASHARPVAQGPMARALATYKMPDFEDTHKLDGCTVPVPRELLASLHRSDIPEDDDATPEPIRRLRQQLREKKSKGIAGPEE